MHYRAVAGLLDVALLCGQIQACGARLAADGSTTHTNALMGLLDSCQAQLEAALAALDGSLTSPEQQAAQEQFARQLGVGLASRLQDALFKPADVTRILDCVESTLTGDDLLGQYTKAVQPAGMAAAQSAVKDVLHVLQLSKTDIDNINDGRGQRVSMCYHQQLPASTSHLRSST